VQREKRGGGMGKAPIAASDEPNANAGERDLQMDHELRGQESRCRLTSSAFMGRPGFGTETWTEADTAQSFSCLTGTYNGCTRVSPQASQNF
jgi:hypothetical protein